MKISINIHCIDFNVTSNPKSLMNLFIRSILASISKLLRILRFSSLLVKEGLVVENTNLKKT